jgi:hypothetical protein
MNRYRFLKTSIALALTISAFSHFSFSSSATEPNSDIYDDIIRIFWELVEASKITNSFPHPDTSFTLMDFDPARNKALAKFEEIMTSGTPDTNAFYEWNAIHYGSSGFSSSSNGPMAPYFYKLYFSENKLEEGFTEVGLRYCYTEHFGEGWYFYGYYIPPQCIPPEYLTVPQPGDVNGDDEVDALDAVVLKRQLMEKTRNPFDDGPVIASASDVNGDGVVDIADLLYLKRHLAGWVGYEF